MSHRIRQARDVFSLFHRELMGDPIDFSGFDPSRFAPEILEEAKAVWQHRVHTEFRSTQIMNRFMTEVLGSGDPIDVYAGVIDLIADEVKHTALCAQVCEALGFHPTFPDPVRLEDPEEFLAASMPERSLATAISMVAINETISVGFVADLQARCQEPGISDVLSATLDDEEGHQDFGWGYIQQSLMRFPDDSYEDWQHLVEITLTPHFEQVQQIIETIPEDKRHLDAWPDTERIPLGLFGPQRQALVFLQVYEQALLPRLKKLNLLPRDKSQTEPAPAPAPKVAGVYKL